MSQACKLLGVSERTLRRVLAEPEQAARLVAQTRQVGGRVREVRLLPVALIDDLRARFAGGGAAGDHQADAVSLAPSQIALLYEQRLADKDALIRRLELDLEFAHQQARAANETASRAQTLLALGGTGNRQGWWQRLWRRKEKNDV